MKKVVELFGFVLCVLFVDLILNYLEISPYQYHRIQNHELYSNPNKYELIAFGPSDCRAHFDPKVAKEVLGLESFNYGQMATTYTSGAIKASFDNAISAQNPKIALFFVQYADLFQDEKDITPESPKTFIHSTTGMTNQIAKLKYYLESTKSDSAIEKIFQWQVYVEDDDFWNKDEIISNIEEKRSRDYKTYSVYNINANDDSTAYFYDGYIPYMRSRDSEQTDQLIIEAVDDIEEKRCIENPLGYDLEKLLKKCHKMNITPYVIMGVVEPRDIVNETNLYLERASVVESIAKQNGAIFIDMNMIKGDLFRAKNSEWDSGTPHYNYIGAEKYTKALCSIIEKEESGEDISQDFYTNVKEYLASLEYEVIK